MHLLNDGTLARLGITDAALKRFRRDDRVLDELCRDLEKVVLAAGDMTEIDDIPSLTPPPDRDLLRLMRELEEEIRDRIESGDTPVAPKGQHGFGDPA